MNGGDRRKPVGGRDQLAPLLRDAEAAADQRLRGHCTEATDEFGFDVPQLGLPPLRARGDVACVRLLVDAHLAGGRQLKCFTALVRYTSVRRIPASTSAAVEEMTRGTDEHVPLPVLVVARLFADHHDPRVRRALTEDGLRGAG